MVRVEVLHQDEGHAGLDAGGHAREERLEGREAARGRSDADDRERGRERGRRRAVFRRVRARIAARRPGGGARRRPGSAGRPAP